MKNVKKNLPYVLFLAPAIIIYTIITFIPVIRTFIYSFTNFNGLSQYKFIGLSNYIQAFQTKNVVQSFKNTLIYAVSVPVLVTFLAILLAVILSGKMRSRNIQRAIFFFPSVISSLFVGYIWNFILSASKYGLVNSILTGLGLEKLPLLSDPESAMVLLILVSVWCNLGCMPVYILLISRRFLLNIMKRLKWTVRVPGINSGTLHFLCLHRQ